METHTTHIQLGKLSWSPAVVQPEPEVSKLKKVKSTVNTKSTVLSTKRPLDTDKETNDEEVYYIFYFVNYGCIKFL